MNVYDVLAVVTSGASCAQYQYIVAADRPEHKQVVKMKCVRKLSLRQPKESRKSRISKLVRPLPLVSTGQERLHGLILFSICL